MTDGQTPTRPDLGALYLVHGDRLVKVAAYELAKFQRVHAARAVVGDVFAKLIETPPAKPIKNWAGYLSTLVRRHAIDVGRGEAAEDRRVLHATDIAKSEADDQWDAADSRLDVEALWPKVAAVLENLPTPERQVIEMTYSKQIRNKDIATKLNVSAGRVTQLRNEALRRLRDAIQPSEGS
jgi:RNA polymerase sigma factor (sigma-70 family)